MTYSSDLYEFNFALGQTIEITDPQTDVRFTAKVIGADHYNERTLAQNPDKLDDFLRNQWVSYTLVSDDAPAHWGNRFWAVDSQKAQETGLPRVSEVNRAFYVASQECDQPQGVVLEKRMSGDVDLGVVGEALYASKEGDALAAHGVLLTYRGNQPNRIWAKEIFTDENQAEQTMVFDAMEKVDFNILEK